MAMIAIISGGIQLSMKKGGPIYKLLGRIWVGLMMIVAISSLFIHEIKIINAQEIQLSFLLYNLSLINYLNHLNQKGLLQK